LVLSQEDSGSRMSRIGKNEIVYGEIMDFNDILREISEVSSEAVRRLAGEILVQRPTLALVGPFKDAKKFEKVLGA
jgi:predicted Zn-dependent peptidase